MLEEAVFFVLRFPGLFLLNDHFVSIFSSSFVAFAFPTPSLSSLSWRFVRVGHSLSLSFFTA